MRLIDADALKNALIECTPYAIDPVYRNTNSNIDMFTTMDILDELPTIDAVPVVRGKWNPIFKGADTCECSVCKSKGFSDSDFGFIATPYCPNCGAKMVSN